VQRTRQGDTTLSRNGEKTARLGTEKPSPEGKKGLSSLMVNRESFEEEGGWLEKLREKGWDRAIALREKTGCRG